MDPSDLDPIYTLTTKRPYSVLGRGVQITDIDTDGSLDVVVSAPGVRGCVYIVLDFYSPVYVSNITVKSSNIHLTGKRQQCGES